MQIQKYAKKAKTLGKGLVMVPLSLLAGSAFYLNADSKIGQWGLNTTRAYAVGLPAVWMTQRITGAARPSANRGSKWQPFKESHGVSGHSFVGAVPFITIARTTDSTAIKYLSYLASGAAGWSRVNDDSHYLSQAMQGWYMAYEAVDAVLETNDKKQNYAVMPIFVKDYVGIGITAKW